jgi:hypothetical protein
VCHSAQFLNQLDDFFDCRDGLRELYRSSFKNAVSGVL